MAVLLAVVAVLLAGYQLKRHEGVLEPYPSLFTDITKYPALTPLNSNDSVITLPFHRASLAEKLIRPLDALVSFSSLFR